LFWSNGPHNQEATNYQRYRIDVGIDYRNMTKPTMMTPKQVLGMDPVGKTGIKEVPKYINYQ
jgi:hypothetical protein